MTAAKKRSAAPAPETVVAKIDPSAPAPTPADAVLRGKASRPTFRRGGLVFGDREWTPVPHPAEIGAAAAAAILAEPVLTLQSRGADGEWAVMPAAVRAELAKDLREQAEAEAREAAEKAETETPAA